MARATTTDRYLETFVAERGALAGQELAWLSALREDGIARFAELGFPGAKNEDWKYTSVASLVRTEFAKVDAGLVEAQHANLAAAVAALPAADDDVVLVFADGRFVADLSRNTPAKGLSVQSLAAGLGSDPKSVEKVFGRCLDAGSHGFAALNAAFAADGALVTIGQGVAAKQNVHILNYCMHSVTAAGSPTLNHTRNIVVAEAGSAGRVIEHYAGDAFSESLTNAVTELLIAEDANLAHVVVQQAPVAASQIHRIEARQSAGSSLFSHVITLGAGLSRTEINAVLGGERAECSLEGLYALGGDQHGDHHTVIDHAAPYTNSKELYKGVMDGDSRGVFTGRIIVRPDSQHIDARQANRNLLLADGAVAEARPQLEIYADDVKCTHGCTVGRLDESSMFYMRQRGIDEAEARRLLTVAFAGEVLETIGDDTLRRALRDRLVAKLERAGQAAGGQGRE
jgi:Fe-S cluster assembly protein SufD